MLTFTVSATNLLHASTYDGATKQIQTSTANPGDVPVLLQKGTGQTSAQSQGSYQVTDSSLAINEDVDTEEIKSPDEDPLYLEAEGMVTVSGSFTLSSTSEVTTSVQAKSAGGYPFQSFSGEIGNFFSCQSVNYTYSELDFNDSRSLAAGTYSFSFEVSADSSFQWSGISLFQTGDQNISLGVQVAISPIQTTTSVISQKNPSTLGQSVTFDATVAPNFSTGGPTPTGNVTFYDGLTPIGTSTLNGNGNAILTTSLLTIGTHSITAAYNGDGIESASTSLPVVQTVNDNPFLVPAGQFTFDAEGNDNSKDKLNYSRHISFPGSPTDPSNLVGVTIGRGYDMGGRDPAQVDADMLAAGIPPVQAQEIANGAGKTGASARDFVKMNQAIIGDITPEQQKQLFMVDYPRQAAKAETNYYTYAVDDKDQPLPNLVAWENLSQPIRDILVDIVYNGYKGVTVMPAAAHNDAASLVTVLMDSPDLNIPGGVQNRTNARIAYLNSTN